MNKKTTSKNKRSAARRSLQDVVSSQTKNVYTHRDSSGMAWRMVGSSRPVSALADKVMAECGMKW